MYLLERLEFIALVGLFVQAFLAWLLVAILASLRVRESSRALDTFHRAFLALALSLSVLSWRFASSHQVGPPHPELADGTWLSSACYATYQALKGVFGLLLVRGCHALVDRPEPRFLRRVWWPTLALLAFPALFVPELTSLLVVQAPVMVACALAALRALSSPRTDDTGLRLVRWSLIGLAATWCVHALAASTRGVSPFLSYLLSFNSLVDLAVQLTLGTGLIVGLLQAAHRRAHVAEREREQLRRAIERDERLRALGTLVSGVAHELNNPLTVILGHAEALATAAPDDRSLRVLREQAERCRGIVHSLSALAGQALHPHEELDLRELAARVVRGLDPRLLDEDRSVRVEGLDGLRIAADRIGVEQVLVNLVVNALHASPPGGTVVIAGEALRAGVALTVTDQGPGVPVALRARLFEPFFTTKEPGRGTGLGLAIAHAIVTSHGGSIGVASGPGDAGARFRVVLPRESASARRSPGRDAEPEPAAPARPVEPAARPEARRLLVVDDDDAVRSVVRARAQRAGWSVLEAASAEAALADAGAIGTHDAVLCDLRMPGMGGAGLHDRLEREDPATLARCVFVTGDLASPESVRFSHRSRCPLVCKPFDFAELLALLERVARERPRDAELRLTPTGPGAPG